MRACAPALLREPLDADVAPARGRADLRGDDRPFALIGAWAGGGAILGSEPVRVAGPRRGPAARVLDERARGRRPRPPARAAVGGGWFGFLGFEARHRVERGHPPPPRPVPLDDGALAYFDHVLRHGRGRALVVRGARDARAARRRSSGGATSSPRGSPTRRAARPFATRDWRWIPSPAGHAEAVEACRTRIAAGDLFQANLCLRLEGRHRRRRVRPLRHRDARRCRPTGRRSSPGRGGRSRASRPRSSSPAPAARSAARRSRARGRPTGATSSRASEKDRAENVMIVDLVRNDLGRVCRPGTVRVTALAEVRPHAGVWHMVSEVEGELRDGVGDADLLRATFPPGSVTGAPKLAALDVIAELESTGREAYTGAIGFASPLAGPRAQRLHPHVRVPRRADLARRGRRHRRRLRRPRGGARGRGEGGAAAGRDRRRARRRTSRGRRRRRGRDRWRRRGRVGGGDADAAPMRRGGAAAHAARGRCASPAAGPADSAAGPGGRAVRDGPRRARRPRDLDAHLRGSPRARRAVRPARAGPRRALPRRPRSGHERARLRIDFVPGEDPTLEVTSLAAIPPARAAPRRRSPAASGAHKWRDRTLLEAHENDDPDDAAAAARRRRLRPRDEPDGDRDRAGRAALHAARRRPHPPERHRASRRARACSPSTTSPPPTRSTSPARCAASSRRASPDQSSGRHRSRLR